MKNGKFALKTLTAALALTCSVGAIAEELHVYNWSDYIAEDTISRFQEQTGIKVTYDVYDSNEVLEAKLLAGRSGYDLVFPTALPFADRHIRANIYQPLDKSQLTNYNNIDKGLLKNLSAVDAGNQHVVPYMWGTTGIGINLKKVKEILGDDMPLDSWKLIFDPEIAAKLSACGISLMDDPNEVFAAAHAYKGEDHTDFSKKSLDAAAKTVTATRANIRYFHGSQYINDLANGDLCVAHGYSGDILQARARAEEANNGVEVAYFVPSEGAVVWTDVMAIPADAPNKDAAHKFINFLMQPDVIAPISNYVAYANANSAATDLVDDAIKNDPGIYPPQQTRDKFITLKTASDKENRAMTRLWTRVKTGQ